MAKGAEMAKEQTPMTQELLLTFTDAKREQ